MSMYNTVCGVNPLSVLLLKILSVETPLPDVPRFRDAYIALTVKGDPRIVIYTRTGGGNRDSYRDEIEALRKHPLYRSDWDDEIDDTYAHFDFGVPDQFRQQLKRLGELSERALALRPPSAKFEAVLSSLSTDATPKAHSLKDDEIKEISDLVAQLARALDQSRTEAS